MARPRKDGKKLCCYLDIGVVRLLDEYCQDSGMPKTAVIERALQRYICDMRAVATAQQLPTDTKGVVS